MSLNINSITFLLGCHMVVADGEINAKEVAINESYPHDAKDEEERSKIFSDAEDKITVSQLLENLRQLSLSQEERVRLIRHLISIGYGDGYYDPSEISQVRDIADKIGISTSEIEALEQAAVPTDTDIINQPLTWTQRLQGLIDELNFELHCDEENESYSTELLSGVGFAKKISDITEGALSDLSRIKNIIHHAKELLADFKSKVNTLSKIMNESKRDDDKDMEAVAASLKNIRDKTDYLINSSIANLIKIQEKKERNIKYFTIAFMGRTKAGKSTLHKIVTHEDNDDIGIGQLRTTRYNRSWFWEKMRIVDTPGIGAPGGKSDTEIARSIIDEADLICYIVTNDSIQTTEFDFLEELKERNKPLFIILNYKSNLTDNKRFAKFFKDPTKWLTTTGNKSIDGHFVRIQEMLSGKYNMDAVRIIPIHLLAAQMYYESNLSDEKEALLKGSNISNFIYGIKTTVFRSGTLKKSMSVIDGCAYQLHTIAKYFDEDLNTLQTNCEILKQKRLTFSRFLTDETDRLRKDITEIIKSKFKELANRADSFAAEEYDNKEAGKKWDNDSVVKSIQARMDMLIKDRVSSYSEKIKDRINELMEDITIEMSLDNNNIKGDSVSNTKLAASIVTALGFAALNFWNPAGWGALVMAGIGVVLSFFVGLFKSKKKKIEEATQKLRRNILDSLKKSESETLSKADENISSAYKNCKTSIDKILSNYITNLDSVISVIKSNMKMIKSQEESLNSLLGLRILEYILKSPVDKVDNLSNEEIASIITARRDWEHGELSFMGDYNLSESDMSDASKVTQMKIKNILS